MKNFTFTLFLLFTTIYAVEAQEKGQIDWANFNKYKNENKTMKSPKVVFMGNSITENWYRFDPEFFKKDNYAGRGISGQVSSQMLVRFRQDVIDLKPEAVVINAGTNDIAENNGYIDLDNILGNIASMAELAEKHGIKVLLSSVLPTTDFPWKRGLNPAEKIKSLNKMIKAYALRHKFSYVDYYSSLADKEGGLPVKYSSDGVHPTLEGYKIMEPIVERAIHIVIK